MSVEIVEPAPGEYTVPQRQSATRPDPDGTYRLSYRWVNGRWVAPSRFIRLRNNTRQPLYCVLLNLTQRFKIDADLFRHGRIEPGAVAAAGAGIVIDFHFPADMPEKPGTSYRDWLKLIVSTDEIDAGPYEMPSLGPGRREATAGRRDLGARTRTSDWWTTIVPIITEVPGTSADSDNDPG